MKIALTYSSKNGLIQEFNEQNKSGETPSEDFFATHQK